MPDPFMVSSYDKTAQALQLFANSEQTGGRILLKVVDDGKGHKHLEARKLSWTSWGTFFDILFDRTNYKLRSVISFLESNNFGFDYANRDIAARAIAHLDTKLVHHNMARIHHLFHEIIEVKQPLPKLYLSRLKDATLLRLEELCEQLFVGYTNVEQLTPVDRELSEFEKLADPDYRVKCAVARDIYNQVVSEIQRRSTVSLPSKVQLQHIVPQKADGNCLLRSFAAGLDAQHLLDPEIFSQLSTKPEDAHALFRMEAIQYLRQHIRDSKTLELTPEIPMLLNEAISEHIDAEKRRYGFEKQSLEAAKHLDGVDVAEINRELKALEQSYSKALKDLSSERAYETYLLLSSQDKFFCTTVHLLALSRVFQVTIELYLTKDTAGTKTLEKIDSLPPVPASRGTVRLHFDPQGPHYDVIVAM